MQHVMKNLKSSWLWISCFQFISKIRLSRGVETGEVRKEPNAGYSMRCLFMLTIGPLSLPSQIGSVPSFGCECRIDIWIHSAQAAGHQGASAVGSAGQWIRCGCCEPDRCFPSSEQADRQLAGNMDTHPDLGIHGHLYSSLFTTHIHSPSLSLFSFAVFFWLPLSLYHTQTIDH